ncbi:MAG: adenylate cyclase [Actinomycetota bacterium]|jgi:adenylate cyclase|nr:adenylate cyclase [Actinomycetota bacterium]
MSSDRARDIIELSTEDATLTSVETARRAGVDLDTARRIWRALGFPALGDDVKAFGADDVTALSLTKEVLETGWPLEEILSIARVYGQSISRLADAESRGFTNVFIAPAVEEGSAPEEVGAEIAPKIEQLLDLSASLLDYVHRKHLSVALQSMMLSPGRATEELAAGFVDLVGFSQLSEELRGGDLGEVLSSFDDIAITACAEAGVRLVKLVGDAAMFVSPDAGAALEAALQILESVEASELLPTARAGVDYGEVVPTDGDYFGRPVNVAARATAFARTSTYLV